MVFDPGCKVAVRMEPRACPPPVLCDVTIELPSGPNTVDIIGNSPNTLTLTVQEVLNIY